VEPSRRFSRLLAALDGTDLRARKAAEVLERLPAEDAVSLLGGLLRLADRRCDPDSSALEGALRALQVLFDDDAKERLRAAAEAMGHYEVLALVSNTSATRSFDLDREQYVDREMRSQTLGRRKQLARSQDRDLLARLATDPDPAVVRNLLANPRTTEREVLVAASRRPARAAVLEEIFRSRRWQANRRVRRALALNPYSPPALSSAALALLTVPDLREVANDSHLAAEVRVQARRLIAHRSGRPEEELAPPPRVAQLAPKAALPPAPRGAAAPDGPGGVLLHLPSRGRTQADRSSTESVTGEDRGQGEGRGDDADPRGGGGPDGGDGGPAR
jgi:hypothetical protein